MKRAAKGSMDQRVIITHTRQGIFVTHEYTDVAELAQSAVTLVRVVAEQLRQSHPDLHSYFSRWVCEAAREGGVIAVDLEEQ